MIARLTRWLRALFHEGAPHIPLTRAQVAEMERRGQIW